MTATELLDHGDLIALEERLLARFGERLGVDEVRYSLHEAVSEFEQARIRTFLAVLIERSATDKLRGLERLSPAASPLLRAGRPAYTADRPRPTADEAIVARPQALPSRRGAIVPAIS
jgi:hypothetical protein